MPLPHRRAPARRRSVVALAIVAAIVVLVGRVGSARQVVRLHRTPTVAAEPAPTTVAPVATSTPATTTPAPAPPPDPTPPPPVWAGKGMWIYEPELADGGDASAIVARAVADGITTIYVRTGSSHDGLTTDWVVGLLPVAHAAGIRVVGWDFPELDDIDADVTRAVAAILATAGDGSRIDGFAADIETRSEGTNLSADTAIAYDAALRAAAPLTPLIACVPRPSAYYQGFYPYAEAVAGFDAIAPMVYWIDDDPVAGVSEALAFLAPFGKPIAPIGQAFDSAAAGGPGGMPTPDQLAAFTATAVAGGAAGVSFWSWQHSDDATFAAIAAMPEVGLG